jgi:nucleotide-binding universal stress UspA family protein
MRFVLLLERRKRCFQESRQSMVKKILVALDGSIQAGKALDLAIDMAKALSAELVLIHVVSDKPLTEGERRLAETEYATEIRQALSGPEVAVGPGSAQTDPESLARTSYKVGLAIRTVIGHRIVERAERDARQKGVNFVRTMIADGDPAATIVDAADGEKPDLLVMGSRGLSGVQELLMGSVSHKVSHSAKCTVAVAK